MLTTYIADSLFDGKAIHHALPMTVDNGKIIAFEPIAGAKEVRLNGVIAPGLIDTQVNGGGGLLFNDKPTLQTLKCMVAAHCKFGTTGLLPTLITDELSKITQAADAIALAIRAKTPGILGVHFEGPHISVAKRGIHHESKVRGITDAELEIYCRDDLGQKILTIAPETVEPAIIKTLVEHNVHVSLGHSNATYRQTKAALDAGATGFTHLFNAMSPLESREPNMIGAALDNKHSWCGIILDGHHVSPVTARIAYQAKAAQKMMLVTDAMSTIGSDQSAFVFDGHEIHREGDKLVSNTGQLAGAAIDMITTVNNAVTMLGISLEEGLRMASKYPAQFLAIEACKGQLSIGNDADFIVLNQLPTTNKQQAVQVKQTWIGANQHF